MVTYWQRYRLKVNSDFILAIQTRETSKIARICLNTCNTTRNKVCIIRSLVTRLMRFEIVELTGASKINSPNRTWTKLMHGTLAELEVLHAKRVHSRLADNFISHHDRKPSDGPISVQYPTCFLFTLYNQPYYLHQYQGVVNSHHVFVRGKSRYSRPTSCRLFRPFIPLLSTLVAHPRAMACRVVQPVAGRCSHAETKSSRILRDCAEIRCLLFTH